MSLNAQKQLHVFESLPVNAVTNGWSIMPDFLFEIGSEEIPSRFQKEAKEQLNKLIDLDLINGQPFFRHVQSGDSLRISGMKGSKKVLQILKEAGVPTPLRKQQLILCDDQKVLAIPTLQINAQIKAHANTTSFAMLCFSKNTYI